MDIRLNGIFSVCGGGRELTVIGQFYLTAASCQSLKPGPSVRYTLAVVWKCS